MNDEASGDDLATMETKNEVLAGDVSTGEGERSSGKVQQRAVWTLMRSRRWQAATAPMIGSAGIDMPAHMWRGIGCAGRVCLPWSWTVSQWSREPVQERGSGAGSSGLQCMSRLCRAGCMVPIWGFRCALYMYISIAVRVLEPCLEA